MPIQFVEIEKDGFHIFTRIKINSKSYLALIDSGATRTIFSDDITKTITPKEIIDLNQNMAAGIGGESLETKIAIFETISFKSLKIHNYAIGLINFEYINASYSKFGLEEFYVIIGSDILKKYNAVINYKKGFLKLEKI